MDFVSWILVSSRRRCRRDGLPSILFGWPRMLHFILFWDVKMFSLTVQYPTNGRKLVRLRCCILLLVQWKTIMLRYNMWRCGSKNDWKMCWRRDTLAPGRGTNYGWVDHDNRIRYGSGSDPRRRSDFRGRTDLRLDPIQEGTGSKRDPIYEEIQSERRSDLRESDPSQGRG